MGFFQKDPVYPHANNLINKLKCELKKLKESEADKKEIKFAVKLLRSRLKGTENDSNVNDFYPVDNNSFTKKTYGLRQRSL